MNYILLYAGWQPVEISFFYFLNVIHLLTGFSDVCYFALQHWIRLELFPDVLVHRLKMIVDPADSSYMPSLVVVSGECAVNGFDMYVIALLLKQLSVEYVYF